MSILTRKFFTVAALLCVTSAVWAQNCTYDWECGNVPYTLCQETSACTNTLSRIAIDQYPNVYFATICPSSAGSEITFKSVPLEGGVPTDLYSVSVAGSSSVTILDGLFNSIYYESAGTLQRVIAGQVINVGLTRPFGGQLNLEFEPEGQSFVCSSVDGSDTVDLYDGLRELYFGFTKSIYTLPEDSCGPSRLGPKTDGSRSTDLFFTSITSGATKFYLGSTTCTSCAPPTPLFTQNEVVADFDVSTQYIFFGTSSGLYRTDLNGQNQVQLTTDSVSGVRVRDEKVYFNAGLSIRSINADGTENTRLDQQSESQSTCQCRGSFTGSSCSECDGQVQWDDGIPSCVATDANGIPESCAQDYQCGNPPYIVCNTGSCTCAHASLSGAQCDECESPSQISWSNGQPSCL